MAYLVEITRPAHLQKTLVKPPTHPKTTKTPLNTGDFSPKILAHLLSALPIIEVGIKKGPRPNTVHRTACALTPIESGICYLILLQSILCG